MIRFSLLPAAVAALVLTPAAMAEHPDGTQAAQGESPVRLVSWDGDFELMKVSRRMRVWRSHLGYELSVDEQGNVTDCELTQSFRMRRVSDTLCDVLSKHHTFEPARNANGEPVEGTYTARISYRELAERL